MSTYGVLPSYITDYNCIYDCLHVFVPCIFLFLGKRIHTHRCLQKCSFNLLHTESSIHFHCTMPREITRAAARSVRRRKAQGSLGSLPGTMARGCLRVFGTSKKPWQGGATCEAGLRETSGDLGDVGGDPRLLCSGAKLGTCHHLPWC